MELPDRIVAAMKPYLAPATLALVEKHVLKRREDKPAEDA